MIPDFQTLMRPVLKAGSNGQISISEAVSNLILEFDLSEGEISELIPSGKQTKFSNRVHWARSYLKQAGLVQNPRRGYFEITDAGVSALSENTEINKAFLDRYDSFQEFKARGSKQSSEKEEAEINQTATPDELMRSGYEQINQSLAADLLERLRSAEPSFFEKTIVQLLLAMGYGATNTAGHVLGGAGDDGVDGVINQDPLGVDQVYIQAKRYKAGNNIGSGAIRDFYGALGLQDVTKGIFVTTSNFSTNAKVTASKLGARIVLIDGVKLTELMIKHEIGCRVEEVFQISRLDDGYFE